MTWYKFAKPVRVPSDEASACSDADRSERTLTYPCPVEYAFAGRERVSCEALGASGSSYSVPGAIRGAMPNSLRPRNFECPLAGYLQVDTHCNDILVYCDSLRQLAVAPYSRPPF